MKKTISEKQIRYIIRSELKSFMIQEGFMEDLTQFGKEYTKGLAQTFKTGMAKSAIPSIRDKFAIKEPNEFGEIKQEINFLLPEIEENLKNLYILFFNEKMQHKSNELNKIISVLQKLKNLNFSTSLREQSDYDIDPTTGAPVTKPINKMIPQLRSEIINQISTFTGGKDIETNSSLIASKIAIEMIGLYERAIKLPNLSQEIITKLQTLVSKVIQHITKVSQQQATTTTT
jgi:hypothetical protein